MENKPLVSVCMITYNHETFISQAIEGVLMQEVDFPIELIIGEDCSTDRTREICLEYQKKYPEILRVLLREKNLGVMTNFIDTRKNCKGKYIALCEGDDYWTDPLKLQKQVDFLEANPDFSACFHQVQEVYQNGNETFFTENKKEIITFEDLAREVCIYTLSFVYRNNIFEFPEWFNSAPIGDWFIFLFNAERGKIKLLDEHMAVYRVHNTGMWSGKNEIEQKLCMISMNKIARKHYYPRAKAIFSKNIAQIYIELSHLYYNKGRYKEYRKNYLGCLPFVRYFESGQFLSLSIRYMLSLLGSLGYRYKLFQKRNMNI